MGVGGCVCGCVRVGGWVRVGVYVGVLGWVDGGRDILEKEFDASYPLSFVRV